MMWARPSFDRKDIKLESTTHPQARTFRWWWNLVALVLQIGGAFGPPTFHFICLYQRLCPSSPLTLWAWVGGKTNWENLTPIWWWWLEPKWPGGIPAGHHHHFKLYMSHRKVMLPFLSRHQAWIHHPPTGKDFSMVVEPSCIGPPDWWCIWSANLSFHMPLPKALPILTSLLLSAEPLALVAGNFALVTHEDKVVAIEGPSASGSPAQRRRRHRQSQILVHHLLPDALNLGR